MIHSIDDAALHGPYEYHCDRCRKIVRMYSVIGLSLLGLILLAAIALTVYVKWLA